MDNGPSCAQLLHFSGQPRSICCCCCFPLLSSLSFLLLLFKPPLHTTTTPSSSSTTSLQFENNKRKAMCLVQLLNSCLVCVSWGGCTSVAGPSIRPMHGPQTSRNKDDKYPTYRKGHGKRWMDMEEEGQLHISKWSDCGRGKKWGTEGEKWEGDSRWKKTRNRTEDREIRAVVSDYPEIYGQFILQVCCQWGFLQSFLKRTATNLRGGYFGL